MLRCLALAIILFAGVALCSPLEEEKRIARSPKDDKGDKDDKRPPPLSKGEFRDEVKKTVARIQKGSDDMAELEARAFTALVSQAGEDEWEAFGDQMESVLKGLGKDIGPELEKVGKFAEQMFYGTEGFSDYQICGSTKFMVHDEVQAHYAENSSMEEYLFHLVLALIKDLGCFKEHLGQIQNVDIGAIDGEGYTEHEAFGVITDILEGGQQFSKALYDFGEALESLDDGKKKKSLGSAKANTAEELLRLLKELDLNAKRK